MKTKIKISQTMSKKELTNDGAKWIVRRFLSPYLLMLCIGILHEPYVWIPTISYVHSMIVLYVVELLIPPKYAFEKV